MMVTNVFYKIAKAGCRFIVDKQYRNKIIVAYGKNEHLPDEEFIPKIYHANTGRQLDLSNPVSFNEKLQWLKLNDRKEIYTVMSDKYLVKEFVAEKIGIKHVIPTLGVWNSSEEIDFDILPSQFVLKCNHNSGLGMCICKDKTKLNLKKVKAELTKGLKQDYYTLFREWSYKNIPRRILAEKFMQDSSNKEALSNYNTDGLLDYKFYCFNGEPKFLYVGFANMINGIKHDLFTFLTLDWEEAPFYRKDHEQLSSIPEKPNCLDEMIEYARILSNGIPFVRVDFFLVDEVIYFSEFTFCPGGGYGIFYPEEWERKLGDWIILS